MNYEYQFSKVIRISDVYRKPEVEVLAAVPADKNIAGFRVPENKEPYLAMDCRTILISAGERAVDEPRLVLKSKTKQVLIGEWNIHPEPLSTGRIGEVCKERAESLVSSHPEIYRIEEREL